MELEMFAVAEIQNVVCMGQHQMIDPSFTSNLAECGSERERILLEQLPVVRLVARRIHMRLPKHIEFEDLVSAGILGLMDAFQKFEPAKNIQFGSYARFRIQGAILDSLRRMDWSPRELRRKGREVEEAIRLLTQRTGCFPDDGAVATELSLGLKEYQRLVRDLRGLEIGTLHMERNEGSGEDELSNLPAKEGEDPLSICMNRELTERLLGAIANLPERERLVSTLYYYMENTMREIGLVLGVAESVVSKIHASAMTRLRSALRDLSVRETFDCVLAKAKLA